MIRSARFEFRSINHKEIEDIVSEILGVTVLRSYLDLNVDEAEQIEVFILGVDFVRKLKLNL